MLRRSERVGFRYFEYGDRDVTRRERKDSLGDTQPIRRSILEQGTALDAASSPQLNV